MLNFFLSKESFSQDANSKIVLTVRAKGIGKVIKRAEVQVGDQILFTDPEGKLELSLPTEGEGKVAVSRFGYLKQLLDFSELRSKDTYEVFLYPAPPGDNEVYIRGEKRPSVSKKTLSVDESSRVAPGGDPAKITQLLPGVQSSAFGSDIAVRGSAPNDSRFYVENFEVFDLFHSIGDISIIPEQILSDVEFYAGGFGPQYGDATGGIVVLRLKNDIPESPRTEFKVNLPFYSALSHERPLSEDSSIFTSARYSYIQYIWPALMPKDVGATVVPSFGDAHALYLKRFDDGTQYRVLAFGTMDGLDLVIPDEGSTSGDGRGTINLDERFATIGTEYLRPLGDQWNLSLTPQYLYTTFKLDLFNDVVDYNLNYFKVHSELSKKLGKKEYFYLGVEPYYGQFNANISVPIQNDDPLYDYEDAPRQKVTRTYYYSGINAWSSIDLRLERFIASPGVRFFYTDSVRAAGYDPRLQLRYELTEDQTLKGAVGQYSKAAEPGEAAKGFGNTSLTFERSYHYVLGLESRWDPRWETDLQLYYKRTINLITSDPVLKFKDTGKMTSRGAEAFIRRNLTDRAFGWLSYTYSQTLTQDDETQPKRSADFDQTHVATLAGSYRLTGTWDLGTRMSYHTGDVYTPVRDAVYNSNLDKYQPRYGGDDDENSERLPDYQRIDLFATKDFLYDYWKLALRFGVQYLAFKRQVYGKTYNYDYSKEEEINNLPPIPFVELKGAL